MRPAFGSAGLVAAALSCWICADTPAVAQGLGGAARGAVAGQALGGSGAAGAAVGAARGASQRFPTGY